MTRNLNSGIGLLLMALGAAGCTAVSIGPANPNPPFARSEYTYDRVQDGDVFRVCFDGTGAISSDPQDPGADVPSRVAEEISRRCGSGRPLVLLIHGCNNTYPEAYRSYHLARLVLRDQKPVFLEVYWDGLSGDPLALWDRAQEHSRAAGLGLRNLLTRVDPCVPVRVVTHSRGSAVIAAAVAEGALPEDIRLALLVPAMGPEDLEPLARQPRVRRVILGVNEDDPALGKGPLPATWFGDTSLGCTLALFGDRIEPAFGDRARLVDLSASLVHDFKDSLLRRGFLEEMVPQLFEEGVAAGFENTLLRTKWVGRKSSTVYPTMQTTR